MHAEFDFQAKMTFNKSCCIAFVLAVLASTVSPGLSVITYCYKNDPARDCVRPGSIVSATSPEECCTRQGGDTFQSGGTCGECIVYGFEEIAINATEGETVEVAIRTLRGTGRRIVFELADIPDTASTLDYQLDSSRFTLGRSDRITKTVQILSDNSTERYESFQLQLRPITPLHTNEFLVPEILTIHISDAKFLSIKFSSRRFIGTETEGKAIVTISREPQLTEDVVILISPLTFQQARSRGLAVSTKYNGTSKAEASNADFVDRVIELLLPANDTAEIASYMVEVPIIDDDYNEASEVFMLTLAAPDGVIHEHNVKFEDGGTAICKISDDDYIGIGFENNAYNTEEGEGVLTVNVMKFPVGRLSEQTFKLVLETIELNPHFTQLRDLENSVPQDIFFPTDQQQIAIQLLINDDSIPEENEAFRTTISGGPGCVGAIGCSRHTTVTILDNDVLTVGFDDEAIQVVESDGTVELCASIISPGDPIEFDFSLEAQYFSGSAGQSTDYVPVNTDLEFSSGQRHACSTVTITDDSSTEAQETFTVQLTTSVSLPLLTISPSQMIVTVVDDDGITLIQFEQNTYTVSEDGDLEVCVEMRGQLRDATVSLCTVNGNAIDGYDYGSIRQDLSLGPENTQQCVTIEVIDDSVIEEPQMFTVSMATSHAVSDIEVITPTATVIIYDDDELPVVTGVCDARDYNLSAVQEESRKEVIEAIHTVLPITPGEDTEDKSLEELYEDFAEAFETNTSETSYNHFVEAVSEIANAKSAACSGPEETKPTTGDIPQLISDFNLAFYRRNRNLQDARVVVGKMLCVQDQIHVGKRKRRQISIDPCELHSCECPPGGLDEVFCPCEFFTCLDKHDDFKVIIGFSNPDKSPCVAFLIDVTGSMGDEIEIAKQIITDFVRHQEDENFDVCYILVPFTDNGSPENSVGPITYADTLFAEDLATFYNNLQALYASGGGDTPEYAFDAMLQALQYTVLDADGNIITPLKDGAHIVVLTDAPSKRVELVDEIIRKANSNKVCIHFFLSYHISSYDVIDRETAGTLVPTIDSRSLSQFIESYETEPCEHVDVETKRSVPSTSECSVFLVSRLATNLRISISIGSSGSYYYRLPTVFHPDGSTSIPEYITSDLAKVSENDPQAGEWTACVETGTIEVSVYPRLSLNTVVVYTIEDSGVSVTTATPQICATKIAILTSQASLIHSANLNLVAVNGSIVRRIPMSICGESLVANTDIALPIGEFTYHLEGIDTLGIPFEYDTEKVATFIDHGEYTLTTLDGPSIEVESGSAFTLSFELTSLNSVCSTSFTFDVEAEGFRQYITPEQATISPGETVLIQVRPFIASSAIRPGSSNVFTLTASSTYTTLTATKTVILTAPPTPPPPPPDACGCENGGTCVITVRRGRERRSCQCPPEYIGLRCEEEY